MPEPLLFQVATHEFYIDDEAWGPEGVITDLRKEIAKAFGELFPAMRTRAMSETKFGEFVNQLKVRLEKVRKAIVKQHEGTGLYIDDDCITLILFAFAKPSLDKARNTSGKIQLARISEGRASITPISEIL